MSIDLLQPPADPSEPHLVLTVHRSLRLPPLIRRLGPGVYHLAVDIRPLLRGRWRQPVAAGLVTFAWWDGDKDDPVVATEEPAQAPFSAPQVDATPQLGPDTPDVPVVAPDAPSESAEAPEIPAPNLDS
jgi:hypothetical protein